MFITEATHQSLSITEEEFKRFAVRIVHADNCSHHLAVITATIASSTAHKHPQGTCLCDSQCFKITRQLFLWCWRTTALFVALKHAGSDLPCQSSASGTHYHKASLTGKRLPLAASLGQCAAVECVGVDGPKPSG